MISRTSRLGTAKAAALFGTASFIVMAGASVAQAQLVAQAPIEEILITGSLIAGAPVVGIPVTALGAEDIAEAGVLTITEMMRNVPALEVQTTVTPLRGGGRTSYSQSVNIHGFSGSGGDPITLLLINGRRWPIQGHGQDTIDPSIVPVIAVDRVDILTVGASATYGSDAVSGVINVIMRRGYDGAMTRIRYSSSTEIGGTSLTFSQLWGTTWDTGNLTMSFETYEQQRIRASARDYYTTNFETVGLGFDATPLAASMPGVITIGNPTKAPGIPSGFRERVGTRYCGNCMRIPHQAGWDFGSQAPGPTTNFATLTANTFIAGADNTQNQRITYNDSWMLPQMQRSAITFAVDQELVDDFWGLGPVSFSADGFYSNRRAIMRYHSTNSGNAREHHNLRQSRGIKVPTTNPYYPAGAPAGVQVNYTFGNEMGARLNGGENAKRWEAGFNFDDMPLGWRGNIFYSMTDDENYVHTTNMININNALAAIGNTIAADDAKNQASFTKPASIPYLNVFCDSRFHQCNSPLTIDYISAFRDQDERWNIREIGANFDGPLFEIPGGPVQAAVSFQSLSQHFLVSNFINSRTHSKFVPELQQDFANLQSFAYFGQLNIPVFGPGNAIPLFEAFDIELGYRIDKYDNSEDYIKTPKIGGNWTLGNGLQLRGSWGESFRNPSFGQTSESSGSRAIFSTEFFTDCLAIGNLPAGPAIAGSLTAILNPTCSTVSALANPGGITIAGGSGLGDHMRGLPLRDFVDASGTTITGLGKGLGPESATQWVLGGNWTPESGWFQGLTIDVSRFHIKIDDSITNDSSGAGPNDPLSRAQFIPIPNAALPITDPANAAFLDIINALIATGNSTFIPDDLDGGTPGVAGDDVKFLHDGANTNLGFVTLDGIDFTSRYDWDMGNWGAWNIGLSAYYEIDATSKGSADAPIESTYEGQNSGARLHRARGRLGWSDGVWSITGFGNYLGHSAPNENISIPTCFWDTGFTAGDCYPGSPYFPQALNDDGTSIGRFGNQAPATVLLDLAIRYQTGLAPSNEYMQNLSFDLTINNVLNKRPPIMFRARGRARDKAAFLPRYDERQQMVSFTITKIW